MKSLSRYAGAKSDHSRCPPNQAECSAAVNEKRRRADLANRGYSSLATQVKRLRNGD